MSDPDGHLRRFSGACLRDQPGDLIKAPGDAGLRLRPPRHQTEMRRDFGANVRPCIHNVTMVPPPFDCLLQRQCDQDAGDDRAKFDEKFAPRFRGVRFVQIKTSPQTEQAGEGDGFAGGI